MFRNFTIKIIGTLFFLSNSINLPATSRFNIAFWSSWQKQCGIALYVEHLSDALTKHGHYVYAYPHDIELYKLINQLNYNKIELLNIQYDPTLFADFAQFLSAISAIKKQTESKIVITVHGETALLNSVSSLIDCFLYFKTPLLLVEKDKTHIIPMGIPIFELPKNRILLRKEYGFSDDDIILTTFGFMLPWKNQAAILQLLVPLIKSDKKIKVQLLTSYADFDIPGCLAESERIKKVIIDHKLEDQVVHVTKFLPQRELSERLWLSDIGYLWGSITSPASSGSARDFIAARLPFVTTKCSHYENLPSGCIRTEVDEQIFIKKIAELLFDQKTLALLRHGLNSSYKKTNCDVVANKIEAIFLKIINPQT